MAELILTKKCRACKLDLPAASYYVKGKNTPKPYLDAECKQCRKQAANAIYALDHPNSRCKGFKFPVDFKFLVSYKRCSRCSTFKGGDKFCSNQRRPDGLSDWCRDCHKRRNDLLAQRRRELAASVKPPITGKECTGCRITKPVSQFYKDKHHFSGYHSTCKPCTERSTKRKNEKGKQRIRERYPCKQCGKIMWRRRDYKEWRGLCLPCLNPRDGHSITAERRKLHGRGQYREWRKAVLNRDGYMCQTCGSMKQLEADHILPWSTHPELRFELSNGRTLCKPCHLKTDTYGAKAKKYKVSDHTIGAARHAGKPLPSQPTQ